jgi:hypothetical protein
MFSVTGDATGRNLTALSREPIHYYTIIKSRLGIPRIDAPNINPRLEENQLVVNSILSAGDLEIDEEHCEALIYDLTYCEVDENKKLVKDRTSDKKEADTLDHFRYYLNTYHRQFFKLPKHRR